MEGGSFIHDDVIRMNPPPPLFLPLCVLFLLPQIVLLSFSLCFLSSEEKKELASLPIVLLFLPVIARRLSFLLSLLPCFTLLSGVFPLICGRLFLSRIKGKGDGESRD